MVSPRGSSPSSMRLNVEDEATGVSWRSDPKLSKIPSWVLLVSVAVGAGVLGGLIGGCIGSAGGTASNTAGGGSTGMGPQSVLDLVNPSARLLADAPLRGTNFGGWLHLEDWFFSGSEGRWVATPDVKGQGVCFPPAVPSLSEPWPSEGFLVHRLNATYGPEKTIEAFEAHRRSFIGIDDIRKVAKMGMKIVRVPLTWALFPDALATLGNSGGPYVGFDPKTQSVIVPDPYYTTQVAYVTVPRNFVEEMLRAAADEGLQLLLDMHCLPGGSSKGTYNGVYPLDPVFWTAFAKIGNDSTPLETVGLQIAEAMIRWVESMDDKTRSGVAGLTFMNEPGHMNAYATPQFAKDRQILEWLAASADLFRRSSLPTMGVRLYVNVVETALHNFDSVVPQWWEQTFSVQERRTWAVIDRHWYAAWSGKFCSGRVAKGGAYFCDQPVEAIRKVWRENTCARKWAENFEKLFPDSLRACSEMSGSTFHDGFLACNNEDVTRAFIAEQAESMQDHGIEPFFWTWRMPYGPTFEGGWSLKRIAGLETPPARPCRAAFSLFSV
mmetsp:Transcript_3767/g.11517  ORF Transcript_3767/g.11517 Transcript_3767/m.11517 type:complete len:551 (+) Transcript_3767:2-1654(+)